MRVRVREGLRKGEEWLVMWLALLSVGMPGGFKAAAGDADTALRYSFSGSVTDVSQDAAGIVAQSGWKLGDVVHLSFVLDPSLPPTYTQLDGRVVTVEPPQLGNIIPSYFHAVMETPLLIHEADGGFLHRPDTAIDLRFGYDTPGIRQVNVFFSTLVAGNDNAELFLQTSDPVRDIRHANWKVGDLFAVSNSANDATGVTSLIRASVRLDSITTVPEPSMWALVGVSMAGLVVAGKAKLQSRTAGPSRKSKVESRTSTPPWTVGWI